MLWLSFARSEEITVSKSYLIDTMIVSWGIRSTANPEQAHFIGWTERFIKECAKEGTKLYLPAPVIAESLIPVPLAQHPRVLSALSQFRILPFDLLAAKEFARLWSRKAGTISEENLRTGVAPNKQIYKFDCQIVAIAVSRKMDRIYSHDRHVRNFASGEIDVHEVPEPPPEQGELL